MTIWQRIRAFFTPHEEPKPAFQIMLARTPDDKCVAVAHAVDSIDGTYRLYADHDVTVTGLHEDLLKRLPLWIGGTPVKNSINNKETTE